MTDSNGFERKFPESRYFDDDVHKPTIDNLVQDEGIKRTESFKKTSRRFNVFLVGSSLAAGAVHGFCDGAQIPLPGLAELLLVYAPVAGCTVGGAAECASIASLDQQLKKEVDRRMGAIIGLANGSLGGAIIGIAATGLGYIAGYGISYLKR